MSTAQLKSTDTEDIGAKHPRRWQRLSFVIGCGGLFGVAFLMRLYTLGFPFDRDSYDEGVYWQTLRAMGAGNQLYHPTFYSQPPAFMLAVFPIYTLFGQTIWSARLGIAIISLLGLLGALLLGKALRGYPGAILALLLLIVDPAYLSASQILQAEAAQVAFSVFAVACAYLWWKNPVGWKAYCYAALCTFTIAVSILCKLFGLATLVPVIVIAIAGLWQSFQQPQTERTESIRSLLVGILIFLLTGAAFLLPFTTVFPQLWNGVVTFHDVAKTATANTATISMLRHFFNAPLSYAALFGTIVALLRRDWKVIPLLGWLIASILLLLQQQPLFVHHFVVLIPPLIALTIMNLGQIPALKKFTISPMLITTVPGLIVICIILVTDVLGVHTHYSIVTSQNNSASTQALVQVGHDLEKATQPGDLVITDTQFAAGLANRNTPPFLVDTSNVRISTRSITTQQMITEAAQPQVHAVLFYTGRIWRLTRFHDWVKQHFHLVHNYGQGKELWVR